MEAKFKSLLENQTWQLTELSFGRKAVNCKWMYALKTISDGIVDRFKALLVAKGYSQECGNIFSIGETRQYSTCSCCSSQPKFAYTTI